MDPGLDFSLSSHWLTSYPSTHFFTGTPTLGDLPRAPDTSLFSRPLITGPLRDGLLPATSFPQAWIWSLLLLHFIFAYSASTLLPGSWQPTSAWQGQTKIPPG